MLTKLVILKIKYEQSVSDISQNYLQAAEALILALSQKMNISQEAHHIMTDLLGYMKRNYKEDSNEVINSLQIAADYAVNVGNA